MRKLLLANTLLLSTLTAAPVLTLDPAAGAVSGAPGATVGWGFSLTSDDTRWVTAIGSFLLSESDPTLGVYSDFIGALGGPVNFFLPAGAPAWSLSFDAPTGQGLGSFAVDALAPAGAMNSGVLRVILEVYDGDPASCGGCFDRTLLIDVPFRVTVTPDVPGVPEPSSMLLAGGALAVLGAIRRRRRELTEFWAELAERVDLAERAASAPSSN